MTFSFIITLFLSILLVAVGKLNPTFDSHLNSLLKPFYYITDGITSPLTRARQFKDETFSLIGSAPSLHQENEKLKDENNLLKIKIKNISQLIDDQETTKGLIQRPWQIQPVRLIAIDNLLIFTSRDLKLIKPGQALASGNSLLGIVTSVSDPIIRVSPLTSPDIKVPVELETGMKGYYVYRNNIGPLITNLDNTTTFNPHTTVLTLPSELIPENLVVGTIDKIISSQASPTQEATILLDKEIGESKNFFIITKP